MTGIDRDVLWRLLGHPDGVASAHTVIDFGFMRKLHGVTVCDVVLRARQRAVPGILLRPQTRPSGAAVLYCHAHGNRYDIGKTEVLVGRPALLDPPLALELARSGLTVLCVDMPGFGARVGEGTESDLAKAALWQGRCLIGDMVRDQILAFRALSQIDHVDPSRVGTFGLSMGATLAYLVAALEPGIARAAHMCAFARMAPLIAARVHDLHGIYMAIPGLLQRGDMDDIAALIAPRPQLVCAGLNDPLTPPEALHPAIERLQAAYASCGRADALSVLIDADAGHQETAAFRRAALEFLAGL